jgi:hypothetical protein
VRLLQTLLCGTHCVVDRGFVNEDKILAFFAYISGIDYACDPKAGRFGVPALTACHHKSCQTLKALAEAKADALMEEYAWGSGFKQHCTRGGYIRSHTGWMAGLKTGHTCVDITSMPLGCSLSYQLSLFIPSKH